MNREKIVTDKLVNLAQNYNIDMDNTHNITDAQYCSDKIDTVCELATELGIRAEVKKDNDRITAIFVNNKRTNI